jgi:hypothetical protein
MGELDAALDALAADDLRVMVAPRILDRTAQLIRARNRIDAELARTVRVGDLTQAPEHDGLATMRSWLRGRARLSPAASGQIVRTGRVLEHLPAVAAAFADGAVTAEQVAVVAPVAADDRRRAAADQGVDLEEVDAVLAETAAARQHVQLGRVVQHYLARLDPDGVEPDPTEGRSLTLAKHSDGSVTGRFELDPVGGEKLQAALESFVQADRPAGDRRTRAQQLADAAVQLADNALASGTLPVLRTVKPQLIVTIPLEDLLDPSTGPGAATTGFGATLSAARARWAACDGALTRLILDPDGMPLDHGRTKRFVSPQLRRAVEHRDRHCVFAGCEAPSHWCDVSLPRSRGHRRSGVIAAGRLSPWAGSTRRSSRIRSSRCTCIADEPWPASPRSSTCRRPPWPTGCARPSGQRIRSGVDRVPPRPMNPIASGSRGSSVNWPRRRKSSRSWEKRWPSSLDGRNGRDLPLHRCGEGQKSEPEDQRRLPIPGHFGIGLLRMGQTVRRTTARSRRSGCGTP